MYLAEILVILLDMMEEAIVLVWCYFVFVMLLFQHKKLPEGGDGLVTVYDDCEYSGLHGSIALVVLSLEL